MVIIIILENYDMPTPEEIAKAEAENAAIEAQKLAAEEAREAAVNRAADNAGKKWIGRLSEKDDKPRSK